MPSLLDIARAPLDRPAPGAPLSGEVLGPADVVHVLGFPKAFDQARVRVDLPAGLTVAELIVAACGRLPPNCRAFLDGHEVYPALFARVRPKPGTRLSFRSLPQGGGGILRSVAMLGLAVAAAFVAPYLAGALVGATSGLGFSIASAVIGAVISAVGSFLINALFPVKPPKISGEQAPAVNFISTARNEANTFGPVPVIFGRHRVAPKYAALPYTEIVGDDQYLRLLFCVGYGPLELSDMRIGTTPLASFSGVELEVRQGYPADPPITLFPNQVLQETFDILLRAEGVPVGPWNQRTTAEDVDEISIDLTMPRGFYRTNDKGSLRTSFIHYEVEYSPAGAGTWTPVVNQAIEMAKTQPVRFGHRWTVPARGQFDVRVRRSVQEDTALNITNEIRWTALRGHRNDPPVAAEQPLCLVALRIKASDQLNGVVDTFNCIAEALLPDWQPAASPPAWNEAATRNPAAAYLAVLRGPANARPVPDARINWDVLQAWHEKCAAEGWTYDRILDSDAGVFDRLQEIATAGRAARAMPNGLWGVIFDDPDQPLVAHVTPRNSWGFESTRVYRRVPHGFRVGFLNEENDWQNDERIVYADGYDAGNATEFEGLDFPGVTSPDLIWRHGRFHLAQLLLRPEQYSFLQDFEQLAVTRGDLIRFTHDVPLFGLGVGRVKAVSGLTVTLDELVPMLASESYVMRFRTAAGDSLTFNLVTDPGERRTVMLVDPGSSPLVLPEADDLWMFGRTSAESVELIVHSVEPGPDLTARIVCVDAAPAIRLADQGEIPPFDSQVTPPFDLRGRLPPTDLRFAEALTRAGPTVRSIASLSWRAPQVTGQIGYEVQHRLAGDPWPGRAEAVTATFFEFVNLPTGTYDFRVRSLGPSNTASDWTMLSGQTLLGLTTPPSDVTGFRVQIIGAVATLTWNAVADLDLSHYEIRFINEPASTALWKNGLVLAENISGTSFQTAALIGTYMIKAVDQSEVESSNAALVESGIASVEGLNVVELIQEHASSPPFAGTALPGAVNVIYDGGLGALRIDDVDQEASLEAPIAATYPFAQSLDLGQVYTSRLTVQAAVQGFDTQEDILAEADVLALVDVLGGEIDEYLVTIEVRWTSGDPAGSPVAWSEWTPFFATDVTARAFEFRARLQSFRRHITPLVTLLAVEIDMPDRVTSAEDVAVGTGGLTVSFTPPFRVLKGLGIAAQDMATGDYAEITNKSESGFDIIFRNAGGTAVARTFDYVARGYGYRG